MTEESNETTRLRKELADAERMVEVMKRDRLQAERQLAEVRSGRMIATYVFLGAVVFIVAIASLLLGLIWNSTEVSTARARAAVPTIHVTCQPGANPAEVWVCSFQQEPRQRGDLGGENNE